MRQHSAKFKEALNYLHNYWRQLFAYRQDGRYTIDNNIAERNIRPATCKNSLFYGSGVMAEVSAVYHTLLAPVLCYDIRTEIL